MPNRYFMGLIVFIGCLAGCAKDSADVDPGYIAVNARGPQWSMDGRYLYFSKGGSVVQYTVRTAEQKETPLPSGLKALTSIMEPGVIISPNGRWAACWTQGPSQELGNMSLLTVYVSDLGAGTTRVAYRTYGHFTGLQWLAPDRLLLSVVVDAAQQGQAKKRVPSSLGTGTILLHPTGEKPRLFPYVNIVPIAADDGSGFLHLKGPHLRLYYYNLRSETDSCIDPKGRFSTRAHLDQYAYLSNGRVAFVEDWRRGKLTLVDWRRQSTKTLQLPYAYDKVRISPDGYRYWSWVDGYVSTYNDTPSHLYIRDLPAEVGQVIRGAAH